MQNSCENEETIEQPFQESNWTLLQLFHHSSLGLFFKIFSKKKHKVDYIINPMYLILQTSLMKSALGKCLFKFSLAFQDLM